MVGPEPEIGRENALHVIDRVTARDALLAAHGAQGAARAFLDLAIDPDAPPTREAMLNAVRDLAEGLHTALSWLPDRTGADQILLVRVGQWL